MNPNNTICLKTEEEDDGSAQYCLAVCLYLTAKLETALEF